MAESWGRNGEKKYGKILADGHFVRTDAWEGITPADAEKAIQLLHAQQQKQRDKLSAAKTTENSSMESSEPHPSASAGANKGPSEDGEEAINNLSPQLTTHTVGVATSKEVPNTV